MCIRDRENTEHLTIRQAEVSELIVEDGQIKGVKTFSGAIYHAKAVVLCTGTYLRARCIYGDVSNPTGPNGLQAATHLTDSLIANGIEMFRFKTGTPARADKRSIDFSKDVYKRQVLHLLNGLYCVHTTFYGSFTCCRERTDKGLPLLCSEFI